MVEEDAVSGIQCSEHRKKLNLSKNCILNTKYCIGYTLSAFLFAALGVVSYFAAWVNLPLTSNPQEKIIFVQNGWGLNRVAAELSQNNLINHQLFFKFLSYVISNNATIQSGEYVLSAAMTPRQILSKILDGDVLMHKVTLPEGMTSWQFAEIINKSDILSGELIENPEEGTLLPETYSFARGYDRKKLWESAKHDQAMFLSTSWTENPASPIKNKEELVILASIVEKETKIDSERPLVAAVFLNRLRLGMPLQADPTVVYGITKGMGSLGRAITRDDLMTDSPFNTYTRKGLPVSPIANPGKASIAAVMNPAPVDYLYFVADGSGGHVFATTLEEHQKNHKNWRNIRENKAGSY